MIMAELHVSQEEAQSLLNTHKSVPQVIQNYIDGTAENKQGFIGEGNSKLGHLSGAYVFGANAIVHRFQQSRETNLSSGFNYFNRCLFTCDIFPVQGNPYHYEKPF